MKRIVCMIVIAMVVCVGISAIAQHIRLGAIAGKCEKTEDLLWNIPYGGELEAASMRDAWGRALVVTTTNNNEFVIRSQGERVCDARDDIALHRVFTPDVENFLKKRNTDEQSFSVSQEIIYFDENKISLRFSVDHYD